MNARKSNVTNAFNVFQPNTEKRQPRYKKLNDYCGYEMFLNTRYPTAISNDFSSSEILLLPYYTYYTAFLPYHLVNNVSSGGSVYYIFIFIHHFW